MIKAVIFDVDGVLVDSFEANFKFFTDLMAKFGHIFLKKEEFPAFFHVPMKDLIRNSVKIKDEEEIHKIWLAGKDRVVPYPHELVNTPKSLVEVIEILSKTYILAIVTSRSRSGIYSLPPLEKLKQYFKVDVAYEDTEKHKPDPTPLILASEKLGVEPNECVYVGDSSTDVEAAHAAGMKVVFYSKKLHQEADVNIDEFSKLVNVISKL